MSRIWPSRAAPARTRTMVAKSAPQGDACLESTYDYGVYTHGSKPAFLHYYAKALPSAWQTLGGEFARSERLDLDIVPRLDDRKIGLLVLFHGKPAADCEVMVLAPTGEKTYKADHDGKVSFPSKPGRYFVRAGYIEADRGGQLAEQHYSETWHYCTAFFEVGKLFAARSNASAAEVLAAARNSRSVWGKGFPGFQAEVIAAIDGDQKTGTLKIDASGSVELTMDAGKQADWVRDQFESMVQHRMPDGQIGEGKVVFDKSSPCNSLGRKIVLDDDRESSYRIKDNVIREVCRSAGPMRFTISVLEVEWNADKKYLPRSFVMNYFDSKSGELRESHAFHNDWLRAGGYDLPRGILEIACEGNTSHTLQVELKNVRLLTR